MGYLRNETNILPLEVALDIFNSIFNIKRASDSASWSGTPNNTNTPKEMPPGFNDFLENFRSWIVSLIDPYFVRYDWNDFGSSEERTMVHSLMLKFACLTLKLPSCIQFCQRQFFAWMDSPDEKISFSPRGRGIVMVVALRTITTKVDESIEFIDGLYQKALEKKKELKGTYATSLFLDSLKSNFTENPAFKNLSIPPEWSVLAESGIGSPSPEYTEFADISAEQALKILETGLDKIYQDHGREVLEANIKHLLKPIVSDISLNRLTKIRNKISARALDTSKREKGETEATRLRYLKEKVDTTVRLMNMYEKKMHSFKKCLPMIDKVIGPLLATFKE